MDARRLLFPAGILLVGTAGVLAVRFVTQRLGAPLPEPEPAALEEGPRTAPARAPLVAAEPEVPAALAPRSTRAAEPLPAAGPASLELRVLSQVAAEPVAGARLHRVDEAAPVGSEPALTDDRGQARLTLEPGVAAVLLVDGSWVGMGEARLEIDPLAPGETAERVVRLARASGLRYVGRVADARTGVLLEGARVELLLGTEPEEGLGASWPADGVLAWTTSGPDGLYSLHAAAPGRDVVRITREGYAPSFVQLTGGHDDAVRAEEVRLQPAATLAATVWSEEGRPAPGLRITVRAAARDLVGTGEALYFLDALKEREEVWSASTDALGAATLVGLPPGVELWVEVTREVEGTAGDVLALERRELVPGGLEVLELALGEGALVRGRAPEASGAPAVGLEVWLAPATGTDTTRRFRPGEPITARATTDAHGRFSFRGVPAGDWWIGPAPRGADEPPAEPEERARIAAPVAQRVTVGVDAVVQDVVLEVERGLWVTGTVLDPAGRPAPGALVGELRLPQSSWIATDDAGAFVYGPLAEGALALQARLPEDPLTAASIPASLAAGASGVVLQLRAGASVAGRLVDAVTGGPVAGQVRLVAPDHQRAGFLVLYFETAVDGTFSHGGLVPTTYHLAGVEAGSRFGVLEPRALGPGVTLSDLWIRLEPAARARIVFEVGEGFAGRPAQIQVLQDELVLDLVVVPPGGATLVTVPAGLVRFVPAGVEPLHEHHLDLDLAPGEEGVVTFHP